MVCTDSYLVIYSDSIIVMHQYLPHTIHTDVFLLFLLFCPLLNILAFADPISRLQGEDSFNNMDIDLAALAAENNNSNRNYGRTADLKRE